MRNGELLLENDADKKTLTKVPFQKILILFIIGHATITTPLIEKCKKNNIALIVTKLSLRPIFFWHNCAEANFLIRKRQYLFPESNITIAKHITRNKISNQIKLLGNTRKKDILTEAAISNCVKSLERIDAAEKLSDLMGLEGFAAKYFFNAYFQDFEWNERTPRSKCDIYNVTLDIGYTMLFNIVESFTRMFGFDIFIGVMHRLWFKRKSLICDIMEPFRCIIDCQTRKSFKSGQFKATDFDKCKTEYFLKRENNAEYYKVFITALVSHKNDIFLYIQQYYRAFMQDKDINSYPTFNI